MGDVGPSGALGSSVDDPRSGSQCSLVLIPKPMVNDRGHSTGDPTFWSSTNFASHDPMSDDLLALLHYLESGGPSVPSKPIIGKSQHSADDRVAPYVAVPDGVPAGLPALPPGAPGAPSGSTDRRSGHSTHGGSQNSASVRAYNYVPAEAPRLGSDTPHAPSRPTNGTTLQSVPESDHGTGEKCASGRAAVYLEYLREAAHEDKQLEGRWTETLNILLIFGGLLSATITAFLIAAQPDLKPAPSDATNTILLQILQRLDNSTILPTDTGVTSPPSGTVRILAWWYTSLACSLTSTFGALLSKQWVLHYESRPSFADTLEKQCELREVRHQGLTKWHFNAIIEVLPVLLQFALLFFAIGLAEYLHPTPALFIITLVFISILASFYVFTLLAGVFLPACPFKTPVTHILFRVAGLTAAWCTAIYLLLNTLGACLPIPFGREKKPVSEAVKLVRDHVRDTLVYFTNGAMEARWKIEFGEQSLLGRDSPGSAGVLGAQLQRHVGEERPKIEGLEVAADAIMKLPVNIGANTFRQRATFDIWSSQVVRQLGRTAPLPRSWLVEADLLFHVIYHFPESASAAKMGVLHDQALNIFTEKDSSGRLAMIIRQSWGIQDDGSLPVATMAPTTVAAYLKFQLSHWCHQAPHERRGHELIIKELPDLLTSEGLRDHHMHVAVIDAISLTAMIMVEDDEPRIIPWRDFLEFDPLERLFQALHRLSCYPKNAKPSRFLALVVEASYRILIMDTLRNKCPTYPSWRNRGFGQTLLRLLQLGRTWWHLEPSTWSVGAPGANLVHQVRRVLALFAKDCIGRKDLMPPGISECGLEKAFTFFAHPSTHTPTPPAVSLSALQLLDYALGTCQTPNAFLGWQRPSKPPNSQPDHHLLSKCPEVLYQLRSIIQRLPERTVDQSSGQRQKYLLSIMVKGRDIFFPKDHKGLSVSTAQLTQDLDVLAEHMQRSGHIPWPLDGADPLVVARTWKGLSPALDLVLTILSTSEGSIQHAIGFTEHPARIPSALPSGSSGCEPVPYVMSPSAHMDMLHNLMYGHTIAPQESPWVTPSMEPPPSAPNPSTLQAGIWSSRSALRYLCEELDSPMVSPTPALASRRRSFPG